MKRRDFFTKLGVAVGAAIVAPQLLTGTPHNGFDVSIRHITPSKIFRIYKQSGNLLCDTNNERCQVVQFLDKKEEEVIMLILPEDYYIVFWDDITLGDHNYIVCRREPSYWVAIEA